MEDIIKILNNEILKRTLSLAGEKCSVMQYGLAEPVLIIDDDNRTIPAIVDKSGEAFDVFSGCDSHDVTMYHKLQDIQYEKSVSSFGSQTSYNETSDMTLFVYGKRTIAPYALQRAICAAISRVKSCELASSSFNSVEILASEYNGLPYFLKPNFFLFQIKYRITGTLDNRCEK